MAGRQAEDASSILVSRSNTKQVGPQKANLFCLYNQTRTCFIRNPWFWKVPRRRCGRKNRRSDTAEFIPLIFCYFASLISSSAFKITYTVRICSRDFPITNTIIKSFCFIIVLAIRFPDGKFLFCLFFFCWSTYFFSGNDLFGWRLCAWLKMDLKIF